MKKFQWITSFLVIATAVFFFQNCLGYPTSPNQEPKRPNIVFILSDDHTSQAWGIYGSVLDSIINAPNIKKLADEGCVLYNVFCTNSICVPSRATILTGQYSHVNQVYTLSDSLDAKRNNVAKIFQQYGYQTAVIGKWHLTSKPAGFDYFNVLPVQGRYHDPVLRDELNWETGGKVYPGFSADVITDLSINWLNKRAKEKPFLLMCHFKATHEPFNYPDCYKDLYADAVIPEPESLYEFWPQHSTRTFPGQVLEILENRFETKPEFYAMDHFSTKGLDSLEARKKTYQTFIKDFLRSGKAIDDNIGRLLHYLGEKNLLENTIIIYTADQGYFLGEHGMFDKRLMYEESLRMPFVIRYPKEIPARSKNTDIILNTDFAPLLLDYANIAKPETMQGESFRENLTGNTPSNWRSAMYYRYWLHHPVRPAHFGIRTDQYKLIFFYGQPLGMSGADQKITKPTWEFYDLKKDPKELNNSYSQAAYQQIIAKLKKRLLIERQKLGDTDTAYPDMKQIISKYWE